MDPADEFYSPYVYCHNDPVNFLDPDGSEQERANWQHYSAVARVLVWMGNSGYIDYGIEFSGDVSNQKWRSIVDEGSQVFEHDVTLMPETNDALIRMGLSSSQVRDSFAKVKSNGYNSIATNICKGAKEGCYLAVSGFLLGGGIGMLVNATCSLKTGQIIMRVSE